MPGPDAKYEKHPAYGQVSFSRQTGSAGRLYGSPLKDHHATISLKITRSEVSHDLGRDCYYGSHEPIIEVRLSPAQFAELLTNMNVGEGVPCTIESIERKRMPPIPETEPVEHEKVEAAFSKDVKETADKLREGLKKLKVLLAKPKLSKGDKGDVEWLIGRALQDVEQNAPFMVAQFGEAATKVVTHAKAEMAAATAGIIDRLGLQKLEELKKQVGGGQAAALPAREE
jgi:hypothetical protein